MRSAFGVRATISGFPGRQSVSPCFAFIFERSNPFRPAPRVLWFLGNVVDGARDMTDETDFEFDFYSSKFGIDPREVEQTNPYLFGRELSNWLSDQLRRRGYRTEVVPEDWGWCVVCQREPYTLFVACMSALDRNLVQRCEDSASTADILWRAVPVAEVSFWKRLGGKVDFESGLEKLRKDVKALLDAESSIRFATNREIEAWDSHVAELVEEKIGDEEPKPVSRWISVPVGLVLLPILLISAIGAASLLYDNPEGYRIIRPVVGTVLLLLIVPLGSVVVRMVIGKPTAHVGLFPPLVLRAFAVTFFLLPIGGLFTGWYARFPLIGTAQAIGYFCVSAGLWRLARSRAAKAIRRNESS